MPIYEYKCENCDHSFEIKQDWNAGRKRKCPECKKYKLIKVISPPIVVVKGEPQTVRQWAEKNTKKMGRYELDDKKHKDKLDDTTTGEKSLKRKLRSMNNKQRDKYIKDGKLP